MTAWITLAAVSVLTLALRAGPSLVTHARNVPKAFQRANRFAAAGLMGALASRSVVGQASVSGTTQVLAAVAVAIPVALWTRSMAATMGGGAAMFLLTTLLLR